MISASLYCRIPLRWLDDPSSCLFEWQTLVAGILALVAALIGAHFIFKQINQNEKHHRDEISRRHNATRATLPIALSSISDVVREISENIAKAIESLEIPDEENDFGEPLRCLPSKFDAIVLSSDVIKSVQHFVETLTNSDDVRHIAELISSVQILTSRYNSFNLKGAGPKENLYDLLLTAAKVGLLNDQIFNYGRYVDNQSFSIVGVVSNSDAWDLIRAKAYNLIFLRPRPDLFFPSINEDIDRYKEADETPWNEKFKF